MNVVSIAHSLLSSPNVDRQVNDIVMRHRISFDRLHLLEWFYNFPLYLSKHTEQRNFQQWSIIDAYRTHKSQSNMFKYLEQEEFSFSFVFSFWMIDILYENPLFVVQVHDSTIVDKHHRLHLHLSLEDHPLLFNPKDTICRRLLSITNVSLTNEFHDFVGRNM